MLSYVVEVRDAYNVFDGMPHAGPRNAEVRIPKVLYNLDVQQKILLEKYICASNK